MRRLDRWVIVAVAMVMMMSGGCAPKSANAVSSGSDTAGVETPRDDSERLFQQLRAGSFQVDAALNAMENTLQSCKSTTIKSVEARQAAADVSDFLDSAGSTVGDYLNAPTLDEVRRDFAGNDERRLKAIEDLNDARREVLEAQGIADPVASDDPDAAVREVFTGIGDGIAEVIDALEGAIDAFGGSVVEPSEDDE